MSEQDCKALEAKWDEGIDLSRTTPHDISSYTETKIHFYEEYNTAIVNIVGTTCRCLFTTDTRSMTDNLTMAANHHV